MRDALGRIGTGIVGHALAAAHFGDRLFKPSPLRAVEDFVFEGVGQVLLPHPAAVVVRVLVLFALRLGVSIAEGIVFEVGRDIVVAHFAGGTLGGVHRQDDGIGLFRLADVDDGAAQGNEPFGGADLFKRGQGGRRHHQRVRVCHAHVFARMHDEAAEDDERVASALDEAEGIVERRIGVAAAQALAEGGEEVVIHVLVVGERLALDGLLGVGKGDADDAVFTRRRGEHRQL